VAEELYRGKVVSDAYLVCDAIFSLPIDGLIALANIKNKKRILCSDPIKLDLNGSSNYMLLPFFYAAA
jgi:hypothetical protein